jgi:hypothetical protein
MKRTLIVFSLALAMLTVASVAVVSTGNRVAKSPRLALLDPLPANTKGNAKSKGKKKPCAANIASCADEGCGKDFDPELNKRKNALDVSESSSLHTLAWVKKLDDPENFEKGGDRQELADLGEGKKVTVTAYLLVAKPELGGESCNCGLQTVAETDNHLVLVSKTTVDKFPSGAFHSRELESITAEFTPRVRGKSHPNFTREKVQPLINAMPQKALLVRVTGQLMFDSEHFLRNHLVRVNNWEIHPVLKLEFCPKDKKCSPKSDANWQDLDSQ